LIPELFIGWGQLSFGKIAFVQKKGNTDFSVFYGAERKTPERTKILWLMFRFIPGLKTGACSQLIS
jgi:hypothetical protein